MTPVAHFSPARPPVIALEGIDGAGTTTQLRRLSAWLGAQAVRAVATAQPSRGPIGVLCRQALQHSPSLSAEALALLFAADRLEHQGSCIDLALAAGAWVICDRHLLSSFAYQSLSLPLAWVRDINAQARPPTLSVLLEVPVAVAQQRLAGRGGPVEAFDALATQARVAQAYGTLARADDLGHAAQVVDGTGDEDAVTQRLCAALAPQLATWRRRATAPPGPDRFGKTSRMG